MGQGQIPASGRTGVNLKYERAILTDNFDRQSVYFDNPDLLNILKINRFLTSLQQTTYHNKEFLPLPYCFQLFAIMRLSLVVILPYISIYVF